MKRASFIKEGDPVVIPDVRIDFHTIFHKEAEFVGVSSILASPICDRQNPEVQTARQRVGRI
jgi:hypothetical protein